MTDRSAFFRCTACGVWFCSEGATVSHPASPPLARLALDRPLVSIDVETTGTNPATDRVVELGIVRLDPSGSCKTTRIRINPGIPIPPEATKVHGITDADVAGGYTFSILALRIAELLEGSDVCGFNLRAFDIPILRAEFVRANVPWPMEGAKVIDAFHIFRARETRTLSDAVRFYLGRAHVGAHGALADAEATLDVLLAQVTRYGLPLDVAALDALSGGRQPDWATECGKIRWNADGHAVFAFGKHSGLRLIDVDAGFLRWVLRSDFSEDVKDVVGRVLRSETPMRDDQQQHSDAASVPNAEAN